MFAACPDWANKGLVIGDWVARVIGLPFYVVSAEVGAHQRVSYPAGSWWLAEQLAIEQGLPLTSRAPMAAHWKVGEMLARHPEIADDEIRRTPILSPDPDTRGTGWFGGVQVGKRLIGASAQPQQYDRLMAGIMHTGGSKYQPTEFAALLRYEDDPMVVLTAPDPMQVLAFLAHICEVDIELCDHTSLKTRAAIFVARDGGKHSLPKKIGVAVEKQ